MKIDQLSGGETRYGGTLVTSMLVICYDFKRITRVVLERAAKETPNRKKREAECLRMRNSNLAGCGIQYTFKRL
jgi:hypothetical protein